MRRRRRCNGVEERAAHSDTGLPMHSEHRFALKVDTGAYEHMNKRIPSRCTRKAEAAMPRLPADKAMVATAMAGGEQLHHMQMHVTIRHAFRISALCGGGGGPHNSFSQE